MTCRLLARKTHTSRLVRADRGQDSILPASLISDRSVFRVSSALPGSVSLNMHSRQLTSRTIRVRLVDECISTHAVSSSGSSESADKLLI